MPIVFQPEVEKIFKNLPRGTFCRLKGNTEIQEDIIIKLMRIIRGYDQVNGDDVGGGRKA